jgi:LPXTG-site transpeptidase (sortase) family protein
MKKSSIVIVAIITLGAAGFFANTLVHAVAYIPADTMDMSSVASILNSATSTDMVSTTTVKALAEIPSGDHPSRLVIPALSIDAHVQDTTITKRGTMGTPTNFTDVAWYEYGTLPGDPGEAVIDGHVDNGLGLDGVFIHLDTIKTGEDIFITRQDGTKLHFVVTSVKWYDYKNVPMQTLLSLSGTSRLALITCGGNWVAGEKTYDERLVVEAALN